MLPQPSSVVAAVGLSVLGSPPTRGLPSPLRHTDIYRHHGIHDVWRVWPATSGPYATASIDKPGSAVVSRKGFLYVPRVASCQLAGDGHPSLMTSMHSPTL